MNHFSVTTFEKKLTYTSVQPGPGTAPGPVAALPRRRKAKCLTFIFFSHHMQNLWICNFASHGKICDCVRKGLLFLQATPRPILHVLLPPAAASHYITIPFIHVFKGLLKKSRRTSLCSFLCQSSAILFPCTSSSRICVVKLKFLPTSLAG